MSILAPVLGQTRAQGHDDAPTTSAPGEEQAPALPEPLVQQIAKGVVLIELLDGEGRVVGTANGFLSAPGVIITNVHCIALAASMKVNTGTRLIDVREVLSEDVVNDIAILGAPIDEKEAAVLELAQEWPNTRIPTAIVTRDDHGRVAASPGWVEAIGFDQHPTGGIVMETTAEGWQGCSGAPLVDHSGKIVGVVSRLRWAKGRTRPVASAAIAADIRNLPVKGVAVEQWAASPANKERRMAASWLRMAQGSRSAVSAEDVLRKASAELPDSVEIAEQFCGMLEERGKTTEAIQLLRAFCDGHPQQWGAHLLLGNMAARMQSWETAIAAYNECLTRRESAVAYYSLGNVLALKGDYGGAVQAYEHAVLLEPRHTQSWRVLAFTYETMSLDVERRRVALAWSKLRPRDEEPLLHIIATCNDARDKAEREAAMTRLRALNQYVATRALLPMAAVGGQATIPRK